MEMPTSSRATTQKTWKDKTLDPSFFLCQVGGLPQFGYTQDEQLPILLPADDSTTRAISVLDRTPVLDLHKIGVLYRGHDQVTEIDMLSNAYGSKAYSCFLEHLGTWFKLDGNLQVYSGGLDTSSEKMDGEMVLAHVEQLTQCVFHVTTLMPTRESDPQCTFKKRHIGNDFVNIIWNENNLGSKYTMDTLEGQFNFMAILVEPLTGEEGLVQVSVLTKPELPQFSLFVDSPRLVSMGSLGPVLRILCTHLNTLAQILAQRFVSSSKERLNQIHRMRERVCGKSVIGMDQKQEDLANALEFTKYT
jgi:hypothetical protein